MDKYINQLTWHERYEASKEDALNKVRANQPMELFMCMVEKKYKLSIWKWALKQVTQEQEQKEFNYEEV